MPNLLGASYRRVDARTASKLGASYRRVDARTAYGRRIVASVCLLFCVLLDAQPGLAHTAASSGEPRQRDTPTKTILLVRSTGDEQVMLALRAEIDDHRYRIVEVPARAERATSLTRLMSEVGAAAALRYNARLARVELSAALDTGSVEEVLRKDEASGDVEILALRTAETLRAHGLELGPYRASPPPSEPEHSASASATSTREPIVPRAALQAAHRVGADTAEPSFRTTSFAHRELWLEVAPGLLASSGGWSTIPIAAIGFRLQLTRDLSLSALGLFPFVSQTVAAAEGSASVETLLMGGTISTTLLSLGVVSSTFGLGASVLATRMRGHAKAGYLDDQELVFTQAPHMSLGLSVALHERWLLVSSLLGGVSIPRVSVLFADRLERSWGSPFAAISLGIAARAMPW